MGNPNSYIIRAINREIKSLNRDGEDNRLLQKVTGPSEPTTNQGDTPTSLQAKPVQIITILADVNGRWHCPVPNCPLASKGYKLEANLANHVNSNHEDSIRINFTYVSPQSNLSTLQQMGNRQFPPKNTSSPTNPNATSLNPLNTNPDGTSLPQCNGSVTAFREQIHKSENFQTIQQHKNVIISGSEDREKLIRALRESGATITSLSTHAPNTTNN